MLDLVVRNGRTIDEEKIEIGILNGKIVSVAEKITEESLDELVLTEDEYLSAGWIDDHVHCFEKMDLYYDYPDAIGVEKGVTTVIDAGTTGAENIGEFYKLAEAAKTNVYAMVNISKWGIVAQDELADLSKIQENLILDVLKKYPDFIVGIKARMSKTVIGDNGLEPLMMAKKIQKNSHHIPLMVHIGSAPPELSEIASLLEKGDIMTHCFNGKVNGILNQETNEIKEFVWEMYRNGVIFDIGHGTDSFNFHVAEVAFNEGLKARSISTDIYIRNRLNGPVYDLATTMEKMKVVGYSWSEIIEKVTMTPAENFHLTSKGQLKAGYDGDLTIFTFKNAKKMLTDSNGNTRVIREEIHPTKTIIGGVVYGNEL